MGDIIEGVADTLYPPQKNIQKNRLRVLTSSEVFSVETRYLVNWDSLSSLPKKVAYCLKGSGERVLKNNYLLIYDSYVLLYNRFHKGEWITRVSGGEGALDTLVIHSPL
jgi:hypothetical protein